jgi:hypothetical protein
MPGTGCPPVPGIFYLISVIDLVDLMSGAIGGVTLRNTAVA